MGWDLNHRGSGRAPAEMISLSINIPKCLKTTKRWPGHARKPRNRSIFLGMPVKLQQPKNLVDGVRQQQQNAAHWICHRCCAAPQCVDTSRNAFHTSTPTQVTAPAHYVQDRYHCHERNMNLYEAVTSGSNCLIFQKKTFWENWTIFTLSVHPQFRAYRPYRNGCFQTWWQKRSRVSKTSQYWKSSPHPNNHLHQMFSQNESWSKFNLQGLKTLNPSKKTSNQRFTPLCGDHPKVICRLPHTDSVLIS